MGVFNCQLSEKVRPIVGEMAETILAFQSQLSGVMETVFKAAMFEITRLVEDSFLEEVTRCREQVDTLKRRLKCSESRRKQREADHQRCVDCGRVGLSNPRTVAIQTDTNVKHEHELPEDIISPQSTDGETPVNASLKIIQSPCIQGKKLRRQLKKEERQALLEINKKCDTDVDENSSVPGPSNHLSNPKYELNWEDGFDQRPESEHNGDTDKPTDPLFQNRYDMNDLDDFNKTGYEDASLIDMGNMEDSLIYMGQYENSVKSPEGAEHQTYHIGVCKNNTSSGSSSRANIDVSGEFGCLLINEEGYLQDSNILYPENLSVDSGSRLNFRDQSNHTGNTNSDCTDMFEQSNVIPDTSHGAEMLQHQSVGKGERRHTCNLCSASFSDSPSLKAHKQTHKSSDLGPPYSSIQRRTFTRACNLKERIYSEQGLQLCSLCGRAFPSISELNKHKCEQRGDKPFSCAVCGNKFSRLWNLKLHQRIHTQEKPHHCGMCDKSFTRADILKVHQRTHTGERPYCCLVCGLSFKRLDHLKSHQRKHMTDL